MSLAEADRLEIRAMSPAENVQVLGSQRTRRGEIPCLKALSTRGGGGLPLMVGAFRENGNAGFHSPLLWLA